ncbi:MAG: hypothetical protein ACFFAS_11740 [Promethearchaeota archaeon]
MTEQKTSFKKSDEKEAKMSSGVRYTIQLSGAAIFIALSWILTITTTPYLPQTPEGFAYFDPVSIVWFMCFLIFGPLAGVLCSTAGMFVMMPYDDMAPIGPLMKFLATMSLMLPFLLYSLYKLYRHEEAHKWLKKPLVFITLSVIGIVLRILIMNLSNALVWLYYFGLPIEGLPDWLIFVSIMNPIQSLSDLIVPYIIVFGAMGYGLRLDDKFQIW